MRVKVRKSVSLDELVDTSSLSSFDLLSVSIRKSLQNNLYFRRKREKKLEAEYRAKIAEEESLKEILLTYIYNELVSNKRLGEKGLVCKTLVLSIKREVAPVVKDLVKRKEFMSVSVKFIEADSDLLNSFEEIPLLMVVSTKVLGE